MNTLLTTEAPASEAPVADQAGRELAASLRKTLRDANYLLRSLEGHFRLTIAHSSLISLILDHPQRVSLIARDLSIRVPSVTEQVIRLERLGLVQRLPDPSDSRAVLVAVTSLGRSVYLQENEERTAALAERLKVLTARERENLRQAVRSLNKIIGEGAAA